MVDWEKGAVEEKKKWEKVVQEKDNIIRKLNLENQQYFETTIIQAQRFEKEEDRLNKIIDKMAEELTTSLHDKEWVIKYFGKLVEEEK